MKVKLISHSQAPDFNESALDLVAYCARVSNPTNQNNKETSEKLVKYLMKHKHWSPLEMISVCLEVETTRDIARQILRHRSFSFQEFSQRYSEATEIEPLELRAPAEKNRQSSSELMTDQNLNTMAKLMMDSCKELYNDMIAGGVAKECARMILPLGTQTTMYMSGSLRSWIHYIQLREANGTQKEHMEIAKACAEVINKIFPMGKDLT